MKKALLLLVLLCYGLSSFSQDSTRQTQAYYQQKSIQQKKVGWGLLVGGTTVAVLGLIAFDKQWEDDRVSTSDAAGYFFLGGLMADMASIPLFISSGRNGRKAVALGLEQQKVIVPQPQTLAVKRVAAVCLKISL